jgi:hypothetical protein
MNIKMNQRRTSSLKANAGDIIIPIIPIHGRGAMEETAVCLKRLSRQI